MKMPNQNENVQNTRVNSKASQSGGKRVENKDNLDSRSGEEQDDKGDDVTHNERETKENKLKKKH
jgi:hypothetical protein